MSNEVVETRPTKRGNETHPARKRDTEKMLTGPSLSATKPASTRPTAPERFMTSKGMVTRRVVEVASSGISALV